VAAAVALAPSAVLEVEQQAEQVEQDLALIPPGQVQLQQDRQDLMQAVAVVQVLQAEQVEQAAAVQVHQVHQDQQPQVQQIQAAVAEQQVVIHQRQQLRQAVQELLSFDI
jgi:hypothetical protein